MIAKQKLHSEEISNHVATLAKNKQVRKIVNKLQIKIIRSNKRICVEGRDIASKILAKNQNMIWLFTLSVNWILLLVDVG